MLCREETSEKAEGMQCPSGRLLYSSTQSGCNGVQEESYCDRESGCNALQRGHCAPNKKRWCKSLRTDAVRLRVDAML